MQVFLDDFVLYSTHVDHQRHLSLCLDRCRTTRQSLNPTEFAFGVTSGKLVGDIISIEGISVNPKNIKELNRHTGIEKYEGSQPISLRHWFHHTPCMSLSITHHLKGRKLKTQHSKPWKLCWHRHPSSNPRIRREHFMFLSMCLIFPSAARSRSWLSQIGTDWFATWFSTNEREALGMINNVKVSALVTV